LIGLIASWHTKQKYDSCNKRETEIKMGTIKQVNTETSKKGRLQPLAGETAVNQIVFFRLHNQNAFI
jgi:hypothetical protein